ncbi:pilN family protein [Hyphomonas neptunium ATCC 15444]|uniref:PilN family protein n=2 Tax=Hyphomonas TaxID=85 RepID=Q0BZ78_HYPNA|nr:MULTISPECIES: pilN family protein [Hyphomonas]ABI77347.1 pilN family protein [Hyphomonas neptunium ATCC 15444]KCZ95304.1 pilN family protein [Hyphomonas hirschiana VP5]
MSAIPVIWPNGDALDQIIGWGLNRLTRNGRRKSTDTVMSITEFLAASARPSAHVTVWLSRREAFVQTFNGRSASAGDLRKIVANEAGRLSPARNADMVMLARVSSSDRGRVDLVHVRTTDLDAIESKARKLGIASVSLSPEDTPDLTFPSPATLSQTHRERRLWTIALLALIGSLTLALAGLGHGLSEAAKLAETREAALRSELLQRREAEREIGALGALAALKPEARTPPARLEMLARLNEHTPQTAWWTGMDMTGTEIRLTGLSDNAAAVLTALTSAFPDQTVRFEETVADTPEGKQKFVILITEPGS